MTICQQKIRKGSDQFIFKSFVLFNIIMSFCMQAKQSIELKLQNELFYQSLVKFDQNFLDAKPEALVQNDLEIDLSPKSEAIIRGKGRPKGQKNCKQRQKKSKVNINEQNRRKGHWSLEQNKKYHWFLQIYNKHFICKEMRRLDKIFKTMALFIGTRQAQQCRSHHQKMQKKYNTFPNILMYLRKLHYSTQDFKPIQEDMRKHEIKQTAQFLNIQQLEDLQTLKKIPQTPSVIEQAKLDIMEDEQKRQIVFQQNIFNLLGEDYEYGFQINSLLF